MEESVSSRTLPSLTRTPIVRYWEGLQSGEWRAQEPGSDS